MGISVPTKGLVSSNNYCPQRSCEGYVFTGVCLSKGGPVSQHALQVVSQHALQQVSRGGAIIACIAGGIPACLATGLQGRGWGCLVQGGLLPGGSAPGGSCRGCLVGGCLVGGCLVGGLLWGALRQTPPHVRDGYCCGRYASHWNAF